MVKIAAFTEKGMTAFLIQICLLCGRLNGIDAQER